MPTQTQSSIVAVFRNTSDAEAAASDLKASGVASSDIFINSDKSATGSREVTGTAETEVASHHQGGITGWFKSIFGQENEDDRPYYEDAVSGGNVFLSVDVTDKTIDRTADILNQHSPIDVHRESGSETAGALPVTAAGSSRERLAPTSADQATAIPVMKEELLVGKRAVVRGGVRVYTRVVEQPVEENISLHEERVRVERTPVNRAVTEADLRAGKDQVLEVKEYAEEAVIGKQARVVEEVRISKDATERTETVRDTIRHTEVNVQDLKSETVPSSGSNVDDDDFRRHFTTTYGTTGQSYNAYQPAYRYGYQMAGDPRYKGRQFVDVESQLREDYTRQNPGGTWESMKDSVRYGWNKLTNKV